MASENVATIELDSGLQISGVITEALTDNQGNLAFIRTAGPTAMAFGDTELDGHGIEWHKDGFSSPVGELRSGGKQLHSCSPDELAGAGIREGEHVCLTFTSGYTAEGVCERIHLWRRQSALNQFFGVHCDQSGRRCCLQSGMGTFRHGGGNQGRFGILRQCR